MEKFSSHELLIEANDLRDAALSDLFTFLPIGNRIHVYDDGFEELTSFAYDKDKPVRAQVTRYLLEQAEKADRREKAESKEDYEQRQAEDHADELRGYY